MSMAQDKQIVKILYLSPTPPPMGGIAKWTETLFKYKLPLPFKIDLVDTGLSIKRKIFSPTKIDKSEIKRTIRTFFLLTKSLIFFRPHIIHLCCSLSPYGIIRDYLCVILSKILRVKIVTHYHGNIVDFSHTALKGLSYKVLIRLIKISHVNLSLNQPSFDFVYKLLANQQYKHHYLLPNFIDDNIFDQKKSKKNKDKKKLRAIYVGAITYQKGVYDIVKIAPEFKDIEFVLIGTISDDFYPLMDNLPQNVCVLQPMDNKEVLKELKKSDFFIFLSYTEGFPNAVLEAMAMGLPIVATNVGAIPEMVDRGKGGYICPVKNVDKIKKAINKLKSHNNFETLGQYNFEKAKKNYSYSVVVDKLCKIYKDA